MSSDQQTRKWKPKLLSSSLPIEYEVARTLVDVGFTVYGDFPYHRTSEGVTKEFSVDVQAVRRAARLPDSTTGCLVDVLVECKYRTRQSVWFFVPDPNGGDYPMQYEIVRGVDEFSRWSLLNNAWWVTQWTAPVCMKGVEVDLNSGAVETAELKHGLLQLQFAQPPLIRSRIEMPAATSGLLDAPFMFVPVLVTNAPLYVAKTNLTSAMVESSDELAALAHRVELLVVRQRPGRDFSSHVMEQFRGVNSVLERPGVRAAEEHRRTQKVHPSQLPSAILSRVQQDGFEIEELANIEYVLVCHESYFATLAKIICEITDRVSSTATLERPQRLHW